jgi:hypothetical protein
MTSWDDVRRIALALPETSEQVSRGNAHWRVRDKGEEVIVEAWLCRAPKRAAQTYLDTLPERPRQ